MTRTKKSRRAGMLRLPASLKPINIPEPPSFDSLPVKKAQVEKAVQALSAHLKKTSASKAETELISQEEHVFLVVTLKEMDAKAKTMPIRIPLPHPLVDIGNTQVCLFTKDPQREYKDLLDDKGISYIQRVVGVEKLKGKFKPFEARRELMNSYDQFLADDNIIPMLPKLLGKKWIEGKKRQPMPVSLKRNDLDAELRRALSGTSLHLNRGTCTTIRVATHEQHANKEWVENIVATIPHLAVRLPHGGWDNVQALHLKSSSSLSLPLWSCDLGTGRFSQTKVDPDAQLQVLAAAEGEDDDDSEEDVTQTIDESELSDLKKEAADKDGQPVSPGQKRKRKADEAEDNAAASSKAKGSSSSKKVKSGKPESAAPKTKRKSTEGGKKKAI